MIAPSDDDQRFATFARVVLGVEPVAADDYLGPAPGRSMQRIYGGELAAQGLRAAALTVAGDRPPHSLHVTYLGLGDVACPVRYSVTRLRDSRHFSTRLVQASQGGRAVATMMASFQLSVPGAAQAGFDYSSPRDPAPAAPPDARPRRQEAILAAFGDRVPSRAWLDWPVDVRYIDRVPWAAGVGEAVGSGAAAGSGAAEEPSEAAAAGRAAGNRLWIRGEGTIGADPVDNACLLTYASDLTMFEPVVYANAVRPGLLSWEMLVDGQVRGATLEHGVWFHRPFQVDQWLLHEHEAQAASATRALTSGRYYDPTGALVASVSQECVIFIGKQDR